MEITLPKRSLLIVDQKLAKASKINDEDWQTALAWCLHKSGFNVSLNKRSRYVRNLEPIGHWLYSILTLCKEAHGLHPTSKVYASSIVWFQGILEELRNADFLLLLESWQGEPLTKKGDIYCQRSLTADLANGINPADPHQQPHLWRLLEAAIDLAAANPNWDKKFLRGSKRSPNSPGFIAAHRRFLYCQESPHHKTIDFESEKMAFKTHGGRRRKLPIAGTLTG